MWVPCLPALMAISAIVPGLSDWKLDEGVQTRSGPWAPPCSLACRPPQPLIGESNTKWRLRGAVSASAKEKTSFAAGMAYRFTQIAGIQE